MNDLGMRNSGRSILRGGTSTSADEYGGVLTPREWVKQARECHRGKWN